MNSILFVGLTLFFLSGCGKDLNDTLSKSSSATSDNVEGDGEMGWVSFEMDESTNPTNPIDPQIKNDELRGTGKVIVQAGVGSISARDVLLETTGKFLSIGWMSGVSADFVIMRQNTDGSIDTSFYSTGKVTTNISGIDRAYGGILQTDGKMVVFGYNLADFVLVRYNTDGSLDTSFNSTGKIVTSITGNDASYGGILQTDGKIIALGGVGNGNNFGLVRYRTDGTLDTSFNSSGKMLSSTVSGMVSINSGFLQSDGKIVAIGNSSVDFALGRFNTDGTLDSSFFSVGIVTTDISGTEKAYGGVLQTDGKIVAIGVTSTSEDYGVARYNTDGLIDTSFNSSGKVITDVTSVETLRKALLQTDGKILAVGSTFSNINAGVVRYSTDGTLDTSFNSTGKINYDISGWDNFFGAALQSDGKFIAVGGTYTTSKFCATRYHTNGTLDTSFYTTGTVMNSVQPGNSVLYALTLETNGNIIGIGSTNAITNYMILRLNGRGELDTSFSTAGVAISLSGSSYGGFLVDNGKILAFGESGFSFGRYNTDGSLDTSFKTSGSVTYTLSGTSHPRAGTLQTDGKVIVFGGTTNLSNFGLLRLNTNGTLDTSFNSSGTSITDISGIDIAYGGILQTDGKFIAIGTVNGINFGLARYQTDGTLDTSFNSTGTISTDLSGTDVAYGGALQNDGKIVAVGWVTSLVNFGLARYNTDGTIDTSFNSTGKVITDISGTDIARAVQMGPNGKIVVVGSSSIFFSVARYLSNGNMDTTFHTNGKLVFSVGQGTSGAVALAIDSRGYYIVGGFALISNYYGFAIIKIAP